MLPVTIITCSSGEIPCLRGHLQTKIFTLNVIVTLKGGGGGSLAKLMSMTLIFEISFARAQKDINSMQVQ